MPKEVVYGVTRPPENPDGTPAEQVGRLQVEVIWIGKDSGGNFVQMVTKEVRSLDGGRLSDDEGIHYTDGLLVDLDRAGINRLIRNLRRARDQAFGRDE